jgi:hypothetical protein
MEKTKGNEVFDPTPFRNTLARKRTLHEVATKERAKLARDFLPRIRDAFLCIDPDIRSIILFGSLSRGVPRRENFDIDIGVRSDRYLRLLAWALKQEWKIDVVDLCSLDGTILVGIETEAEILYER